MGVEPTQLDLSSIADESAKAVIKHLIQLSIVTKMPQWHVWSQSVDLELSKQSRARSQLARTITHVGLDAGLSWTIVLMGAGTAPNVVPLVVRRRVGPRRSR